MVTYGFYNSINHDRVYDATQMSEIFDGIIRDGVYQYVGNKFLVDKNGLDGFQIRVGTGRAWFNHTWTKNDAPLILTLPAPPTLDNYYRADAIVIDINANINVRENKITYVTGTEVADNPSPPYPELLDGEHKQVALAYIVRKGAETEINAANINYVVGSNPCPYVTAPVQAVDLSAHVAKWQAAWEQWFHDPNGYIKTQERAFKTQIEAAENLVNNATSDVTEEVAEFRIWIASQKSQFDGWMDDSKNDFDSWFRNLQYILDGDVAGHLQNEIEALDNRVVPIEKGGTGNTHGHIQSGQLTTDSRFTTKGEFSTAEGMNTAAVGKASHAEGAGDYTYEHREAGLVFDEDYYVYGKDLEGPVYIENRICPAVEGASKNVMLATSIIFYEYDLTDPTRVNADNIRLASVAILLRDLTDDTILKHEVVHFNDVTKIPVYHNGSDATILEWVVPFTPDHIVLEGSPSSNYYNETTGQYDVTRQYAKAIWYMDGTTEENSNIIVDFLPCLTSYNYPAVRYKPNYLVDPSNNKIDFRYSWAYFDSDHTYPNHGNGLYTSDPYIRTSASNTHSYRFDVYYSYTLISEDESVNHDINWVSAGDYLTMTDYPTRALGNFSHAEGFGTKASGIASHAEGFSLNDWNPDSKNPGAIGDYSHSEGYQTWANGEASHSEGKNTKAVGKYSHSSGYETTANGHESFSIGAFTEANGERSFAGGYYAKAHDDTQFAFGYDAHIPGSGTSNELKNLYTSIFSLPMYPRYIISSKNDISGISTLDDANNLVNKNRGGFSIGIKCTTSKNGISYKTILPNDTFATFLELIELIEGDPNDNYIAYSGRILKLFPIGTSGENCGLAEACKLFDVGNLTGVMVPAAGSNVIIGGNTYKYPVIEIKNSIDSAISTSSISRFIKYSLIRII